MEDAVPAFSAMLRKALGGRLRPDAHSFVEMFAPDGVMEFPYGLPGFDPIHGRDMLAGRLRAQGGALSFTKMGEPTVHEASDGKTFVVEFVGTAKNVRTGETADQKLISVITVEDGWITTYKDYWNPLALLGLLRGAAWASGFLKELEDN